MSLAEIVSRDLRLVLRKEFRENLMEVAEPWPPPCDIDAEAEILSAVLDPAHVTRAELAPLEAKHFYAHIHQNVWEVVGECAPGDVEGVRKGLVARGYRGKLEEELHRLELCQPWVALPRLRGHVARLIELWARRELVAAGRAFLSELRHGIASPDNARRRLEQRFREVLG